MKKFFQHIIVFIMLTILIIPSVVSAVEPLISEDAGYSSECISKGTCELNDFIILLVRGSQIMLGVVGSIALLMFIYGGVTFVISEGNAEKVKKAKEIIIGSIIGLVIVFSSYMLISFILKSVGISSWDGGLIKI